MGLGHCDGMVSHGGRGVPGDVPKWPQSHFGRLGDCKHCQRTMVAGLGPLLIMYPYRRSRMILLLMHCIASVRFSLPFGGQLNALARGTSFGQYVLN